MARSRDIAGPYDLHPQKHLITSKHAPDAVLQRSGHGQIVETPDGQFYHTHLCSRPLPGLRRSPLGRETAIQKCVWRDDGWLYLEEGGMVPSVEVSPPRPAARRRDVPVSRRFDGAVLPPEFQWLRTPYPERLFTLTGSALRLHARESIGSWHEQSLVARRQEHHSLRAQTELVFDPENFQQAAGLVHYYNRHKFHFAAVTWHETAGRSLTVMSCLGDWPDGRLSFALAEPVALPDGPVRLAAEVRGAALQFLYHGGAAWKPLGPVLDASVISDEGGRGEHASFTGAFIGMAAFDTSGAAIAADFSHFDYEPAAS
jgi:xylan 1,4-beta-xylosidase